MGEAIQEKTFQKTIIENIQERERDLEPTYRAWADFHGISVREFKKQLQKLVRERVDESDFFIQLDAKALVDLLNGSGRLKNQFETGQSSRGKLLRPGARKSAEEAFFGIPKNAEPTRRPVYGYLSNKENGALASGAKYGDIVIKFNRRKILPQTTVTFGHSWGHWIGGGKDTMIVPTSAEKPHFTGVYVGPYVDKIDERHKGKAKKIDPLSLPRSGEVPKDFYEAQYHGNVTKSHIESIHVSQKTLRENEQLRELLEKARDSVKVVVS